MAALDATDPYPRLNECARRAGCEPPMLSPGDRTLCLEVELVMYWPFVPAALQETRSQGGSE